MGRAVRRANIPVLRMCRTHEQTGFPARHFGVVWPSGAEWSVPGMAVDQGVSAIGRTCLRADMPATFIGTGRNAGETVTASSAGEPARDPGGPRCMRTPWQGDAADTIGTGVPSIAGHCLSPARLAPGHPGGEVTSMAGAPALGHQRAEGEEVMRGEALGKNGT
jgi:hypothetical protein